MTRAFARGACPGLSAPMPTGDGLLVRFLPAAPIPLDAFIGVCAAARRHGNGTMEISARGSLQIRGLTPDSAPRFAAEVAALAIDICDGVQIVVDPLPADPAWLIDPGPIAAAIRDGVAERPLRLAPKISVLIDGGGCIDLDALFADIRLRAVQADEGPRLHIALAGNAESATPSGIVSPGDAADSALDLLARIAALGPEARAADLLPMSLPAKRRAKSRREAIGMHSLENAANAIGVGLAFGHARADRLMELAAMAKDSGASWARAAPDRALLLGPFNDAGAMNTLNGAEAFGFIVAASDPRRRIAACPGAPHCMHGLIAARTLAAEIARGVALPQGDGIALHVSGCAKGCAHPQAAPLTIVGTAQGCGLVRDGTARATPNEYVAPRDIAAALAGKEAVHA